MSGSKDIEQKVGIALQWTHGETTDTLPILACTWSQKLNGPIGWSATLLRSRIDPDGISDDDVFHLVVRIWEYAWDGTPLDGTPIDWTSPPLVASDPQEAGGRPGATVVLSGADKTSWQLSGQGYSHDTIHDRMATELVDDILGLLADPPSVTFLDDVHGDADWQVEDFDIVAEEDIGSFIARLCRDGGWNFRIGADGGLEIFLVEFNQFTDVEVRWESWLRNRRKSQLAKHIIMRKGSKQKAEYRFPVDKAAADFTGDIEVFGGDLSPGLEVSTVVCVDNSTGGKIQYAALYDGPSGSGALVGYFQLDPTAPPATLTGSGPALSVVFGVLRPTPPQDAVHGDLVITGKPPGTGDYDGPRTYTYPETAIDAREKPLRLDSMLWDKQTFMEARAPMILQDANNRTDTVSIPVVIRFRPQVWVGDSIDRPGLPVCKISDTKWGYNGGKASQSLELFVTP